MDQNLMEFVGEKHYPFVKKIDEYIKLLREIHSVLLLDEFYSYSTLGKKKNMLEEDMKKYLSENNYKEKIPDFYSNIIKQKIVEIKKISSKKGACYFISPNLPSFC